MRKPALFLTCLIVLFFCSTCRAQPEPFPEPDFRGLQKSIHELQSDWQSLLPSMDFGELLNEVKSGRGFDWQAALRALTRYFFREVVAAARLLGQLLVLVVFASLLSNLARSFPAQDAVKVAQALLFLIMMTVAIQSYHVALCTGRMAIDNMVSFMQALLPVLFTMMVAGGSVASVPILHPFLLAIVATLGTLTLDLIFPLLYLSTALSLVTYVVPEINVGRLAGFVAGLCATLLGLALCVFTGFGTIQGATAKVIDNVSIRSAKFLSSSFVPVIGKLFSDALEIVVGYSAVLRTAVSAVGMVLLLLICAFPLLKILAMILVYKLAAALADPIADARVAQCLGGLGNSLALIFATVGVVALLFFLSLVTLVGVGSFPWGRGV